MNWIDVKSENDLPVNGQLVILCRDLEERKQYYVTERFEEEKKYWEMNNIVGWLVIEKFE